MTERKRVVGLKGCTIRDIYLDKKGYLVFIGKYKHPLFTVKPEDLFDGEGNHFNDEDIEFKS